MILERCLTRVNGSVGGMDGPRTSWETPLERENILICNQRIRRVPLIGC